MEGNVLESSLGLPIGSLDGVEDGVILGDTDGLPEG